MIKSRMAQRGQGGFTLIELLVVVAILAILVGVAVVGVGAMQRNAKKSACIANKDTIETAAEAYRLSDSTNPEAGTIGPLTAGTSPYLKKVTGAWTINWTNGSPSAVPPAADFAADCTPV